MKTERPRTQRRKQKKVFEKAAKAQVRYNKHANLTHLQAAMDKGEILVANMDDKAVQRVLKIQKRTGWKKRFALWRRKVRVFFIRHPKTKGEQNAHKEKG